MSRKASNFKEVKKIKALLIPFNLNDLDVYTPTDLGLKGCFHYDFETEFTVPEKFILLARKKEYFVDTQGYEYIRYIAEIIH
jgi:hypothetical protein